MPVACDLNLGGFPDRLRRYSSRKQWGRGELRPEWEMDNFACSHCCTSGASFSLPQGEVQPAGYVLLQKAVRLDRPTNAYHRWPERIAAAYEESVLGNVPSTTTRAANEDPNCVATLRNYSSLVTMASEARKPMFDLRPADGAMGSHAQLVQTCYMEFECLANRLAEECQLLKAA
jgi:hypothetical protein